MLNVEIFTGSPRKNGNSTFLARELLKQLSSTKVKVNLTRLYEYEIKPCIDCRKCKKDEMNCILQDGMLELYPKIESANVIIFSTPIYWYGPSAQTKLFIDRLRPHYANKKLSGKKGALITPAAEGSTDCDLTIEMFSRVYKALGIEMIGTVTAECFDIGEAANDITALNAIKTLAAKI